MGLDQFGVSGGPKKPTKKKEEKKEKKPKEEKSPSEPGKRYKFYLSCIKSCGFKKVIRKRALTDDDYECPKCGRKLKLTKKE